MKMKIDKLTKKQWNDLPQYLPLRSLAFILHCSYPHLYILLRERDIVENGIVGKTQFKKWLDENPHTIYRNENEERQMEKYVVNDEINQKAKQVRKKTHTLGYRNYRIPEEAKKVDWESQPKIARMKKWSDLLGLSSSSTMWKWCNECKLRHYIFPQRIKLIEKRDLMKFLGV